MVKKRRQIGISTVTALYCTHKLLFASDSKPESIIFISPYLSIGVDFLNKIRDYLECAPDYLIEKDKDGKVIYSKKNSGEILLPNGSGIKVKAASVDALRGYMPTLLIMDEAAFIRNSKAVWDCIYPCISNECKVIIISSPNLDSYDSFFNQLCENTLKGKNNFKIYEIE